MKKNLRQLLFVISSCLIINSTYIHSAYADTGNIVAPTYNDASLTSSGGWQFLVAPYLWGAAINGDYTTRNFSSHFSLPFSDIWNNLDFVGEIHVEANNGPWTIMIDPTYLKLSANNNAGNVSADLTSEIWIVDGALFYTMFNNPMPNNQMLTMETEIGARYIGLDNSLTLTYNSPITPAQNFSSTPESNNNFLVPIVGLRFTYDLNQTSHFWLRGDIGGFGIDNVSNTWQTILGYSYSLSDNVDLGLAYRVLKIDFDKNSNAVNTYMYGPEIGIGFHF